MIIRNAVIEDLKEIAAVELQCFPEAEAATEKSLKKRLEVYPDHFWLLYDGKKLVGFINGMATDEPDLSDEMYDNAGMHKADGR